MYDSDLSTAPRYQFWDCFGAGKTGDDGCFINVSITFTGGAQAVAFLLLLLEIMAVYAIHEPACGRNLRLSLWHKLVNSDTNQQQPPAGVSNPSVAGRSYSRQLTDEERTIVDLVGELSTPTR